MRMILWVDDDKYFIAPYIEFLEDAGFRVLRESDASSGLSVFEENRSEICCVILDMAMDPGIRFTQFESRAGYNAGMLVARNVNNIDKRVPIIGLSNFYNLDNEAWFKTRRFSILEKAAINKDILLSEVMRAIDPNHKAGIRTFIVHGHDGEILLQLRISCKIHWDSLSQLS